jgi:2-dehydropantoate 2-reductase
MTERAGETLRPDAHIAVFGAGSIGCFIGGLLSSAGRRITLLGRPHIVEELDTFGLHLTDFAGRDERLPRERVVATSESESLRSADLVLLTVKSGATPAAAAEIAAKTHADVPVVSLQNGLDNPPILKAHMSEDRVLAGVVAFNAVRLGNGRFHRGSSGGVIIEEGRRDILEILRVPGLSVTSSANIAGVQWGKLLANLNNALNALSGLPLRQQLEDRAWRRILAAQIAEAYAILRAAGIRPLPANRVPLFLMPYLLRLPDKLFRIAARPALKIDPEARSSMWEDLMHGRPTEVDYLQGAIVHLASQCQRPAPVSERILRLIKQAEAARAGPPGLRPEDVRI